MRDAYTYVNGNDWGNKENIAGQICAFGQYSDREFYNTIVDRKVNHCFAKCGEGVCDNIVVPTTAVTVQLDMTGQTYPIKVFTLLVPNGVSQMMATKLVD